MKNVPTVQQAKLMYLVNDDVFMERVRQNEKWGLQRHDLGKWLAIFMEEVGEVAQAMQSLMGLLSTKPTDANDLYKELIQASAVANAIAEQIRELEELMGNDRSTL